MRALRRLISTTTLAATLTAVPLTTASAADTDPPGGDTTAPMINLNPCYDAPRCRLVEAQVFGNLQEGDDLAVLGARIGDRVLAEKVYDDGSGFQPEGDFPLYANDVPGYFDYGLSITVPRGSSAITFYARDLAGNTSELTTTVLGPIPPSRPHLTVQRVDAHRVDLQVSGPNTHNAVFATCTIRTPGREPRTLYSLVPYPGCRGPVVYHDLRAGWHRFTARARTVGGLGPVRTVRAFVPRALHR